MDLALPIHFALGLLAVTAARLYTRKILRSYDDMSPLYEDCGNCGGPRNSQPSPYQPGKHRRVGCAACNYRGVVLRYEPN